MVHPVMLAEGHAGVAAIDAGAGGVDQVLHTVVAATLQDVGEARDIALDIGMRIHQRIAHPGLGGQMHHAVEPVLLEQRLHARAVRHIQLHELKARLAREPRQAVMLELGVVVVVQIVQAHHLVAAGEQDLADMHADKAGRAGNQDFHAISSGNLGSRAQGRQGRAYSHRSPASDR
jgi:hypothetical protein